MNFQLSKHVNKNKIFLVSFSELDGRLDPVMALYQKKVAKIKYNTCSLSGLLIGRPQYGANEVGVERKSVNEPRYIRITDIDENGLLKKGIGKTADVKEAKFFLKNNDLLFARSGSVGRAYIHKTAKVDCACFYAGYMIKFVLDENKINPDYVFVYAQLNIFKDWVNAIQRTVAQPNINAEEYKSLKIPTPSKAIQNKIVAKMDFAYTAKKKKEEEARRLLSSIDEYLLGELGINLPVKSDNILQNRIFVRQFSEVVEGRFDPFYYKNEFKNAVKVLNNSIYELKKLKKPLCFIESGSRPEGGVANIRDGILSFGGEHVNNQCEIEIKKPKYIPVEYHQNNRITETKLNDVLLVKDGATTGKVGIISDINHVNQNINEHVFLIRFYSEINPEYFVSLLNTEIYQILIKQIITGGTVTGLTKDVVRKLKVPVPPVPEQIKFAKHIAKIRAKVKQLQQQAKADLEQAKKEVQVMILGEK